MPTKPARPELAISLRTVILLVTVVFVLLAASAVWLGVVVHQESKQRQASVAAPLGDE